MRPCHQMLWYLLIGGVSGISQWEDKGFDPLAAHGGIFRSLPWNSAEIAEVSSMHSRGEYHNLMNAIKEKLLESDLDVSSRRKIERFMLARRPPEYFEHLFEPFEKQEITHNLREGNVDEVLSVWRGAMGRLPPDHLRAVIQYITSKE